MWEGTAYHLPLPFESLSEVQQSEYKAIEKLLHENVVVEDGRFIFMADRNDVLASGLPESYFERFQDHCKWLNSHIRSENRYIRKMIKAGDLSLPADDIRILWQLECQEYVKSGLSQINPVTVLEE